jgi:peptidyl-prolyl cis-trans isomerase SurA
MGRTNMPYKVIFTLSRLVGAVLVLFPIFVCGCGDKKGAKYTQEELEAMPLAQRDGLPACSGGLVLRVNNDFLTMDEVVEPAGKVLGELAQARSQEEFDKLARPQLERFVWNRISDMLLYQEAKKSLPEGVDEPLKKVVDEEVGKFVAGFGGDYAMAEKTLKEMGLDWQEFHKEQKKFIITQSFLAEKVGKEKAATHKELLDYYDEIKDRFYTITGTIRFRLIDIQPASLVFTGTSFKDPQEAREEAIELAEQLIERLKQGEDFGKLAMEYSKGHRASEGGLWNTVQLGSLAEPYDVLEREAENLQPGRIAGPIETDNHIFIMKLETKQQSNYKPFEEVQNEVESRLVLKRRQETLENLIDECINQADIGDTEVFIEMCLQEIYRRNNI